MRFQVDVELGEPREYPYSGEGCAMEVPLLLAGMPILYLGAYQDQAGTWRLRPGSYEMWNRGFEPRVCMALEDAILHLARQREAARLRAHAATLLVRAEEVDP